MQGSVAGRDAVLKVFNGQDDGAIAAFVHEADAYQRLESLQGASIVRVLGVDYLRHLYAPVIVLERGHPLPAAPLSGDLAASARDALGRLHAAGAAHNDVRARNMVVCAGCVLFSDLGRCTVDASAEQQEADEQELADMLAAPSA